jgi:hypothetical protein
LDQSGRPDHAQRLARGDSRDKHRQEIRVAVKQAGPGRASPGEGVAELRLLETQEYTSLSMKPPSYVVAHCLHLSVTLETTVWMTCEVRMLAAPKARMRPVVKRPKRNPLCESLRV